VRPARRRESLRLAKRNILSRHGGIMTYLLIARFLARCALIGARRCSSANLKRRAAFTSLADSDSGHLEARASRVRQHDKLLRKATVGLRWLQILRACIAKPGVRADYYSNRYALP
jgi:hypothetical protein